MSRRRTVNLSGDLRGQVYRRLPLRLSRCHRHDNVGKRTFFMTSIHREIKQDRFRTIFQRLFAGIVSTTKVSLLGNLLFKISALLSLGTQLRMGKGTPALRFRSMAFRLLQDLFKALDDKGSRLQDAILKSIRLPDKLMSAVIRGQIAKQLYLTIKYGSIKLPLEQ